MSEYDIKKSEIPWPLVLVPLAIGVLYNVFVWNLYALGILAVLTALHFILTHFKKMGEADIPIIMFVFSVTYISPIAIFAIACIAAALLDIFYFKLVKDVHREEYPFVPYITLAVMLKVFAIV